MTVSPDGWVELRQVHRYDDEQLRFRVSQSQAARFERILRPYRPAGVKGTGICDHSSYDEPELFEEVVEEAITWRGRTEARLYSCHDVELWETISEALWAINLYPGGEFVSPDERGQEGTEE